MSWIKCQGLLVIPVFMMAFWAAPVVSENVSGPVYETLTQVQKLMQEDNIAEAGDELNQLMGTVEADTIDQAVVMQMVGRLELEQERYPEAIEAFQSSYETQKLPDQMQREVGRMLAQLHAAEQQYETALVYAQEWLDGLEAPKARQFMFLANLMAQTERFGKAIEFANKAIDASDEPRESWFQLLVAASFNMGDYAQAAEDLKRMVRRWPDKPDYWEQLANIYVQMDNRERALAVLQLAWKSDTLTRENSIHSMIQLAINRGIPERGARLLDHALQEEALPVEDDYIELLARAWISAREYDAGVQALERLAQVRQKGEPYLRIAKLLMDQGDWHSMELNLKKARDMGVEEPGEIWVLLGITLIEQEDFEAGFEALRKARAYDESRERAQRWLKYARQLQKQHNWKMRNQNTASTS